MKKRGLGKGLSSLFEYSEDIFDPVVDVEFKDKQEVPLSDLLPSPWQPRKYIDENALDELAESIRLKGILQPIIVRKSSSGDSLYEIIAGERRWRAAKKVGLFTVPVIVKSFSDLEAFEVSIVENIQRESLSVIEEARAYAHLLKSFCYTQEDVAKMMAKSRVHIANTLRLLQLPEKIQEYVDRSIIKPGHARALIGHEDALNLCETIIAKNLSVRQVENLVRYAKKSKDKDKKDKSKQDLQPKVVRERAPIISESDLLMLKNQIEKHINSEVSIKDLGNGGIITLKYKTLEDLDDIVCRLSMF